MLVASIEPLRLVQGYNFWAHVLITSSLSDSIKLDKMGAAILERYEHRKGTAPLRT